MRRVLRWTVPLKSYLSSNYAWIPQNWTWSKIKPVIRCALAGWISLVLFVIPKVELMMGSAGFLILIAVFLSPPSDAFIAVLEREFLFLSMCCLSSAWSCLGIFLANLARHVHVPSATLGQVIDGKYIEARPSIIIGVFIFFGSAFILWVRANRGRGPFFFPCVISCLVMDICLTNAALFPYPFYPISRAVLVPISLHTAVALVFSLLVFPSTISAVFTTRLSSSLTPVLSALSDHAKLLATPLNSAEFAPSLNILRKDARSCETELVTLAAAGRLLKNDLIYARFAPDDFIAFQGKLKRLAGRMDGLGVYFSLVDLSRERFPGTIRTSSHSTTPGTPRDYLSRATSRTSTGTTPSLQASPRRRRHSHYRTHSTSQSHLHFHDVFYPPHSHHSHHHNDGLDSTMPHHLLHSSLLMEHTSERKAEYAVGIFESQRYLNLEAMVLMDPNEDEWNEKIRVMVKNSCTPLLEVCSVGVTAAKDWISSVRNARLPEFLSSLELKARDERFRKICEVRDRLAIALESFRTLERHAVLEPYRYAFEEDIQNPTRRFHEEEKYGGRPATEEKRGMPPHRCLFNCFLYQYNLMQLASIILEILDEILKLEDARHHCQLWIPLRRIMKTKWNFWSLSEPVDSANEDDDPGRFNLMIHHAFSSANDDLGLPQRRDPDHLPPRNLFEAVMVNIHKAFLSLGSGNVLFALKGGLLSVTLALPSLLRHSAKFAYENRFVWGIFMGQMALARFQGDTTFALWARITSTFFGALVGMIMWYISCGSGHGNSYGLAAVSAVCFPFFFYARLYWPVPILRNFVFFVTASLVRLPAHITLADAYHFHDQVIGYSYQDVRLDLPGNPGYGWSVAWRRFITVTCGVSAAFIASFFPPSTTIRGYQRHLLATTSAEIGTVYCSILSFANTKYEPEIQEIISTLLAVRNKLGRLLAMRINVGYEFSLQGRWPADRYQKIVDLQMNILFLSHLMSVLEHMDPAWSRAFLRRTRFINPDFQGDVLAVISMMSFALRTGSPLPQITPCPLVDRFMLEYRGLNAIHKDSEDDYGLPRTLSMDTLKDEQYLMFCVGIATAFSILSRLDRLMVAVKEVVGEHYHIHGVGVLRTQRPGPRGGDGSRANAVHFNLPSQ
ncbi:hypothetical protein CPB84DRAFT_1671782 [Gymnopilus junonius]|uniref:DUF2421 domain-containing protein n=1 Tax=Gymnopilus junonius TaxID=109634 RepID=A0A9P5P0D9_GYMJU|nr:hypothetical protein CPB84DRAFT_1671782 [Gymnopilus junonius]